MISQREQNYDDEEFQTQEYLVRQKLITDLQQKYISKRQELDKYLKKEESISSPPLYTYETNYSSNQSFKKQPSYETSTQQQEQQQIFTNNNFTSISTIDKKYSPSPISERKSLYQTNNSTTQSTKSPQQKNNNNKSIIQKKILPKKINKETQTQLTMSCKISNNMKFQIHLQKILDQTLTKSTQTTQQLKEKTQNITIKQQKYPENQIINKYAQRFKTEYSNIKDQQFTLTSTPNTQTKNSKKVTTKNQFEQWYKSQKQWVNNTENKIFQQRMEKEQIQMQQEQRDTNFSPRILKNSQEIVKQKFQGCQFMDRQQQYDNYLKMKQQRREQEEQQEIQSQRFRMSPISKQIVRSITPKSYRDYSTGHTTNTSWFVTHTYQQ